MRNEILNTERGSHSVGDLFVVLQQDEVPIPSIRRTQIGSGGIFVRKAKVNEQNPTVILPLFDLGMLTKMILHGEYI